MPAIRMPSGMRRVMKIASAAAQGPGGLEVGAGGVDEQVEQFGAGLVLHGDVVAADDAEVVGGAGDGVGPHGHRLVRGGDGGAVRGVAGDGDLADVPVAEQGGGDDLGRGHAAGGDGAELVPGRLAGGRRRRCGR